MDVLSDVLRGLRLEGALFLHAEFGEPWCVQAPAGAQLALMLPVQATRLAICHLVLEGSCRVQWGEGQGLPMRPGDVVVLPRGEPHCLASGAGAGAVSLQHLVAPRLPDLTRIRYGGAGDRTRLVCGWLALERGHGHPLLDALPSAFLTSLAQRPCGGWLTQSVLYALDESAQGRPGADLVGARVAEALFVEALRGHLDGHPDHPPGWTMGSQDPQIGRCLSLLHGQPARAWDLASLAHEVGVSRSVLAGRFQQLVGMAPMHYLARWRLVLAARLLGEPRSTVARVCEAVGYASESAFHRAFKREYGLAPGHWRRRAQRSGAATPGVGVDAGAASSDD